ncbi:MAG: hypothetical protein ACI8PT_003449 [Gammaproteobacteria bacterium]|jgi:hypothetical protein
MSAFVFEVCLAQWSGRNGVFIRDTSVREPDEGDYGEGAPRHDIRPARWPWWLGSPAQSPTKLEVLRGEYSVVAVAPKGDARTISNQEPSVP